MDKLLSTLDQGSRVSALQPAGVQVSTGAQGYGVQTNMFGPQPGGIIPGTGYQNQLPPTTPIVNPQTGAGGVLGELSQRTPGPVVTSVGPQQQAVLTGAGNVAAQDWVDTANAAKAAPGRIAIFQNIKRLAPDAFTGPTAERRQWVASFAQTMVFLSRCLNRRLRMSLPRIPICLRLPVATRTPREKLPNLRIQIRR